MKKTLFLMLMACVSLSMSCKKSDPSNDGVESEKHEVKLVVSDFGVAVEELSKKDASTLAVGDTLKNHANNLYYFVYNSSGELINKIKQISSLATFGTVADKLPAGQYTVVLMASKSEIGHLYETSLTKVIGYTSSTLDDTFFKKLIITVANSDVTQNVRLDRIVGAVQVTLTDAIPSNASKITIVAQNEGYGYYYNDERVLLSSTSVEREFPLTVADKGVRNKSFMMYILNTSTSTLSKPLVLSLRAYDAQNGLISEKIISDVLVFKNKRTVLSGALFNGSATSSLSFTVSVNPTWDSDVPVRTF